nr:PAC2 family protein [Pseudoclavibacter chungangensis]
MGGHDAPVYGRPPRRSGAEPYPWANDVPDDRTSVHDDPTNPAGESAASDDRFASGRILVVALQGWNDAGESATAALGALGELFGGGRLVARIDDEHYFDYSINRPHVVRGADGERAIDWPSVDIVAAVAPGEVPAVDDEFLDVEPAAAADAVVDSVNPPPLWDDDEDEAVDDLGNLAGDAELRVTASNIDSLYLLTGPEPTLQWRRFAAEVLRVCQDEHITRVVLVGALLADVPHTRPIGVFVSSEDPEVRAEFDVGRSNYQGPTGVLSVLSMLARTNGMPAVSVWASVPHYAHQSPSPKATLALLDKLEEILDVTIPRAELTDLAREWEQDVDSATSQDPEIVEYVTYLERAYDTVEAPEASGEAIAKEFERFLRSGDGRGPASQAINTAPWTAPVARPSGASDARDDVESGGDEEPAAGTSDAESAGTAAPDTSETTEPTEQDASDAGSDDAPDGPSDAGEAPNGTDPDGDEPVADGPER